MTQNRDSSGRFAAATTGTPAPEVVATASDAAATFQAMIDVFNDIANDRSLCGTYDRIMGEVVAAVPGLQFADGDNPRYYLSWHVQGTVYMPDGWAPSVGSNRNDPAANDQIRAEYEAWAAEHNLPLRGSTFVCWIESLPERRRTVRQHGVRTPRDTYLDGYANYQRAPGTRERDRRKVTLRTPVETPAEPEMTSEEVATRAALLEALAAAQQQTPTPDDVGSLSERPKDRHPADILVA